MTEYKYTGGTFQVTQPMKDDFTENGYIVVRHLLNSGEVEKVKYTVLNGGMMDHSYKVPDKDGRSPVLILWRHPGNDITGLLGRCEKVITTSEQLLGVEELYHFSGKVITKFPLVGGSFEWHQDYGYWYRYCLTSDMMAVFIAVDECTQENGGLNLLKGSHKYGRVDHGFSGGQQGADIQRVELLKERCELVKTNLQPGDAIFFHSNTLHYSGQNNSTKRRMAVVVSLNERSNEPVVPNISPQYTPVVKVPNSVIEACDAPDNFTGKEFISPSQDELVNENFETKK